MEDTPCEDREELRKQLGTGVPAIHKLPYVDMIIIGLFDGAHCGLLGLAKTHWLHLIRTGLRKSTELTSRELDELQELAGRVCITTRPLCPFSMNGISYFRVD